MIKLSRILEQYGMEGQFYDLGKDFANFRRTTDGAQEQIKQKFEKAIGSKLNGKRVKARASRGYKQYIKDYEFDVAKVTLDDYYDNFVVVAHDTTTPKAKEYFLKPGFKIQILGPATGQPSPQKGGRPEDIKSTVSLSSPDQPKQEPSSAQHQPMALAPVGNTSSGEPVKEQHSGYYDAYPIDAISNDIKSWIPQILIKPETALRDFIKGLGWQKELGNGTSVAIFDLKIPSNTVKNGTSLEKVKNLIAQVNMNSDGKSINTKYTLTKIDPNQSRGVWNVTIKKTMTRNPNI